MGQADTGWADPKALEVEAARDRLREIVDRNLRREELVRQVNEPSDQELAAEEAQLP